MSPLNQVLVCLSIACVYICSFLEWKCLFSFFCFYPQLYSRPRLTRPCTWSPKPMTRDSRPRTWSTGLEEPWFQGLHVYCELYLIVLCTVAVYTPTLRWTSTSSLVLSRMFLTWQVSCCLTRRMSSLDLNLQLTGGNFSILPFDT